MTTRDFVRFAIIMIVCMVVDVLMAWWHSHPIRTGPDNLILASFYTTLCAIREERK